MLHNQGGVRMKNNLVWNVYNQNFNAREIEVINLFDKFDIDDFIKLFKKRYKNKEQQTIENFKSELKNQLMYRFWSRCEWEVIITAWPPDDKVSIKVDVYEQIMNNFDVFCDYVWKNTLGRVKSNG